MVDSTVQKEWSEFSGVDFIGHPTKGSNKIVVDFTPIVQDGITWVKSWDATEVKTKEWS